MTLEVIILAAGEGVRMRSSLPKALHTVGGRAMLAHVIAAVSSLAPDKIHVVVGHQGARVRAAIERAVEQVDGRDWPDDGHADEEGVGAQPTAREMIDDLNINLDNLHWVTQKKQLGTGHAAMQAMPSVDGAATLLILYGDTPLIGTDTLRSLVAVAAGGDNALGLLTATVENPTGLGRIVRDRRGKVVRIVEEKDADHALRKIRECNAGFIAAPAGVVQAGLAKLDDDNAQREFYLTDLVAHAAAAGVEIVARGPGAVEEILGVNSHADLARVERIFQLGQARRLLDQGVRLRDPARFDLRGQCQFGRDCVVDINVILAGRVVVGDGCEIGANAIIRNSRIGARCVIEANCVIDHAVLGARCRVGPFARLRPHARLDDEVRIGNFVEVKNSRIGRGSKANHLSYVGDSALGEGVNVGAGVITCNYDGAEKHRTVIGDDVFIGSNSQLVAPLVIGAGATIGAGSTITEDVAGQTLAVGRARQRNIDGWQRPVKGKRSTANDSS